MISLRQRVLWASLLAGSAFASTGALAQAPLAAPAAPAAETRAAPLRPDAPPHARGERGDPAQHFARMQEHRAKRLGELKDKLKLSASQEGAWTTFTSATQPPAGPRPQRLSPEEVAKLTTPQRLERAQAHQAERSAMFSKRADATRAFYATLNAEQQKTFDAETARFAGRHGGPDHHGRGGPDGHRAPPPPPAKG